MNPLSSPSPFPYVFFSLFCLCFVVDLLSHLVPMTFHFPITLPLPLPFPFNVSHFTLIFASLFSLSFALRVFALIEDHTKIQKISSFSFSTKSLDFSSPHLPHSMRKHFRSVSSHSESVLDIIKSLSTRPKNTLISIGKQRQQKSNTIRNGNYKDTKQSFNVNMEQFRHFIGITNREKHRENNDNITLNKNICSEDDSDSDVDDSPSTACVEPSMSFYTLLSVLIPLGFRPLICVELQEITIGGAINGGGIESSSFQYGQFNDQILSMEIIIGSDHPCQSVRVVHCSPHNEFSDLFFGVSSSYNSVGLITLVTMKIHKIPRDPIVKLSYLHFKEKERAMDCVKYFCDRENEKEKEKKKNSSDPLDFDYIEGIQFSSSSTLIILGKEIQKEKKHKITRFSRFWDVWYAKHCEQIIFKHKDKEGKKEMAKEKSSVDSSFPSSFPFRSHEIRHWDFVSIWDYSFRYHNGAFWTANYVMEFLSFTLWTPWGQIKWDAHYSLLSRIIFGYPLNATFLWGVLHQSDLTEFSSMRVIQDIYTPSTNTIKVMDEIHQMGQMYPLWICPIKRTNTKQWMSCHFKDSDNESDNDDSHCINIGVYGRPTPFPFSSYHFNRSLVSLLLSTGSHSMLYTQNFYTEEEFHHFYRQHQIDLLRSKYHTDSLLWSAKTKVLYSQKEIFSIVKNDSNWREKNENKIVKKIIQRILTTQIKSIYQEVMGGKWWGA